MPNAGAFAATARPIRPRPMMPELLAAQLHAEHEVERPALPLPAPNRAAPLRRSAGSTREDQRPGQLRGRFGEHVGRVRDDHAAGLHRRHVDVVVADRDVGDDLKVRRASRSRIASIRSVRRQISARLAGEALLQLVARDRRRAVVEVDVARGLKPCEDGGGYASGETGRGAQCMRCIADCASSSVSVRLAVAAVVARHGRLDQARAARIGQRVAASG